MTYEIMYCPICGTQNEAKHLRAYQDGSVKKEMDCRICGHMIYMEIVDYRRVKE